MHHTINLAHGDSITIISPDNKVTIDNLPKEDVSNDEINKYPIFKRICEAFNITIDDVTGKRRKTTLVIARCIISYDLCTNYKLSLNAAGKLLNRDHTGIIHYLKRINEMLDTKDAKYLTHLKQIEEYEKDKN